MIDTNNLGFIFSMVSIPFFIVGLIGNVLVIRIVHKTREMHTTTNYLLANLAVSDVLTILIFWLVIFIRYGLGHVSDELRRFICKGWWIGDIAILVSSFTLTLLAVERYHALLKPLRTGLRLNQDNIKQAIATVWISSVLFSFPSVFLHEWNKKCIPTSSGTKIHLILTFALNTYIPLIIFLFCYGSLIKGLYFSKAICTTNTEEDRSSAKKKLVITFILATAGFVIGYTPIVVYYTMNTDAVYNVIEFSKLETLFFLIFLCSLCLNPVLYAFQSTNFQEGFKRIIFCREPPLESGMQLP